ncbi:MAG TPA: Zn-dependent hydrolase [Solirubrobacterales bacterium]|nr:Zn-dependent hydrolase [Solirubrobacterales bacterium]
MTPSAVNDDLARLAQFGTHGDAVRRLAWSDAHRDALDWLASRFEGAGLEASLDPAGNLIGRWQAGSGKAVVLGSHIDSGPEAGRYDGTLGVLGGLAAVELLKAKGVEPRHPVWVASFMDEEGVRFGASMLGSRAFVGQDVGEYLARRDADGVSVAEEMRRWGLDPERIGAAEAIDDVGAYLELHIEQGPVLERAGEEVGIVTGIVGMVQAQVRLDGEANHAGTTPMDARRDAVTGLARAALALREEAVARGGTATIGSVAVEPGAFTVIPARCEFSLDFRIGSRAEFDGLRELIETTVRRACEPDGLEVEIELTDADPPVEMDAAIVAELERAAARLGATARRMPSGAGHDAMLIAPHVPTAMLFVPSRGGISHSPLELTDPEHCELGVQVLAGALEALVG